jgi:trk system potassium uptake protein TrkH
MTRDFNYKLILKIQGSLLILESLFLLSAVLVAIYYGEPVRNYFILAAGVSLALGLIGLLLGRNAPLSIGKREGSVIVTSTWILFSIIGMLPFWLSGSIPSFTNAFFETISGFTTTGASILNNIEELPYSLLYWRSLTHWIGGLGIIVISMALLPIFGFNGGQLFSAEATGPTKDKIHPKISGTAKRLLAIYIILTLSETVLLWMAGMGWFDAVCHSFGTIATGGFSTKQASIAHFNSPLIDYIIIFFMVCSGINFSIFYFIVKLKTDKVFNNEELRYYLALLFGVTFIIVLSLIDFSADFSWLHIEESFRHGLFTVSSIITTTGYGIVDYTLWKPFTWILLIMVMLMGSSAGSTAGGIKVIRILLIFKYCYFEFKRLLHPNAVFPVRYNSLVVKQDVITRVLAFTLLYCILIAFGVLVLSLSGMGFIESVSGMITCLSDVGPGFGDIGPNNNFEHIPSFTKWFLTFIMLIGRLELFTVLLIFTPAFWKR